MIFKLGIDLKDDEKIILRHITKKSMDIHAKVKIFLGGKKYLLTKYGVAYDIFDDRTYEIEE